MPFAPSANPDLAAQFMYQGISGAGAAFGDAIGNFVEKHQTAAKERKAYLSIADVMSKSGQLSQAETAALQNADTDTIKGYIEGKKFSEALNRVSLENQLTQAQRDALIYNLTQKKSEDVAQERFNELMQRRLAPAAPTSAPAPFISAELGPDFAPQAEPSAR